MKKPSHTKMLQSDAVVVQRVLLLEHHKSAITTPILVMMS